MKKSCQYVSTTYCDLRNSQMNCLAVFVLRLYNLIKLIMNELVLCYLLSMNMHHYRQCVGVCVDTHQVSKKDRAVKLHSGGALHLSLFFQQTITLIHTHTHPCQAIMLRFMLTYSPPAVSVQRTKGHKGRNLAQYQVAVKTITLDLYSFSLF